jgi:hypothetical protein
MLLIIFLIEFYLYINDALFLWMPDRKVLFQNSKPYPFSLTLKQLQMILNDDLSVDLDCFNLFVQKIMFDGMVSQ